jgi:transaldolase
MPAGCRGGYHISALSGADMVMSIAPGIASSLASEDVFEKRITQSVDKGILDRLCSMPEFRKAYEPDGMSVDEFITFGACNRTLDQFVLMGWNVLKDLEL